MGRQSCGQSKSWAFTSTKFFLAVAKPGRALHKYGEQWKPFSRKFVYYIINPSIMCSVGTKALSLFASRSLMSLLDLRSTGEANFKDWQLLALNDEYYILLINILPPYQNYKFNKIELQHQVGFSVIRKMGPILMNWIKAWRRRETYSPLTVPCIVKAGTILAGFNNWKNGY